MTQVKLVWGQAAPLKRSKKQAEADLAHIIPAEKRHRYRVRKAPNYKTRWVIEYGKVHISKKEFAKVSKDYKGKETMTVLDPKTGATVNMPVVFEEVDAA